MKMQSAVRIQVDGRDLDVAPGANLLAACLAKGIYIPHLCYLEHMTPAPASCRLCFVSIAGSTGPVAACTVAVTAPISVRTDSPEVRRLQRAGLRLLVSVHRVDCKHCPANRRCELQRLARFLKIGLNAGPFERHLKEPEVDSSFPCLDYYPNRCVLCGKCVHVCGRQKRDVVLTFSRRGFDTRIGAYGVPADPSRACGECRACVEICPTAALRLKGEPAGV